VDLEGELAAPAATPCHLTHQINGFQANRHGLQKTATSSFADHLFGRPALGTNQSLILKDKIKLDRTADIIGALILVMPAHSKGFLQQSLTHFRMLH